MMHHYFIYNDVCKYLEAWLFFNRILLYFHIRYMLKKQMYQTPFLNTSVLI